MSRAEPLRSTHGGGKILGADTPVHARNIVIDTQRTGERLDDRSFQLRGQFRRLPYRANLTWAGLVSELLRADASHWAY
jgi:hypothetical protein